MNILTPDQFRALPCGEQYERYLRMELRARNAEALLAEHLKRLEVEINRTEQAGQKPVVNHQPRCKPTGA